MLSRNTELDILVILKDCKFGMAKSDILTIENWLEGVRKPIGSPMKSKSKLLPVLKLSNESHQNFFQNPKLKRTKTLVSEL